MFAAGLALLGGLAGSSLSAAATPTVTAESQAWWRREGISVPGRVGAHIHAKATLPADGHPVTGLIQIPVTVTLHDARGSTTWFRIGTENQQLYLRELRIGPCLDCSTAFVATIDLSGVPTGRHEVRMSANNPDEDPALGGEQRMFQSTGYQICVRSCTPSYRDLGVHIESRGWYEGVGYQNVRLDTDPRNIRAGGLIDVRFGPGSGGAPTRFAGIYIDPDFHAGRAGTVVREWSGAFSGSVRMPSVAPGPHKLVLLSSDGQNAGVLAVPFIQGTSPVPTVPPDPTRTPAPTPTRPPDTNIVTTRIGDNSRSIAWRGRWALARHPSYYGDSVHWTRTKGSQATLVFDGTRIRWIGPSGPTRGKARVYVDGRSTVIDTYSSRFRARRVLFSRSLADGRHTIKVVALGTSGRPVIAIDAFEISDPR